MQFVTDAEQCEQTSVADFMKMGLVYFENHSGRDEPTNQTTDSPDHCTSLWKLQYYYYYYYYSHLPPVICWLIYQQKGRPVCINDVLHHVLLPKTRSTRQKRIAVVIISRCISYRPTYRHLNELACVSILFLHPTSRVCWLVTYSLFVR